MSIENQRRVLRALGLRALGLLPPERAKQPEEPEVVDFDGGCREPAPPPSDPEADHGQTVVKSSGDGSRGKAGGERVRVAHGSVDDLDDLHYAGQLNHLADEAVSERNPKPSPNLRQAPMRLDEEADAGRIDERHAAQVEQDRLRVACLGALKPLDQGFLGRHVQLAADGQQMDVAVALVANAQHCLTPRGTFAARSVLLEGHLEPLPAPFCVQKRLDQDCEEKRSQRSRGPS
jgi:hypothetical protein